MRQTTDIAILPFKVMELAEIVAEKKKLPVDDALLYIYNSRLYNRLSDPEQKLWYDSGARLYDMLEEEKLNARKLKTEKTELQFLVFCVEQYGLRRHQSSAQVLESFRQLGVDRFLKENYEVLHSQGVEYIVREIETFINNRR